VIYIQKFPNFSIIHSYDPNVAIEDDKMYLGESCCKEVKWIYVTHEIPRHFGRGPSNWREVAAQKI